MRNANPILNVQLFHVEQLHANEFNPNMMRKNAIESLRDNILSFGWTAPIVITPQFEIIDGFHRWRVATLYDDCRIDGKVPCVVVDCNEYQKRKLCVKMNSARGDHQVVKMHDIVKFMLKEKSIAQVASDLGLTKGTIKNLSLDTVFDKYDINKDYSEAWDVV